MAVLGKPNLGPNFYAKLVQVAQENGMQPEDLLAVMVSESGLNPSAYEQKYKGAGLVGFMPDTLKGLGFKGDWHDFASLSGEEQLEWLRKLIRNYTAANGGRPLDSAGRYYTANLWPVALKLPGVQKGDPNTRILEENPETVEVNDPKKGMQRLSKKYWDIKVPISAEFESRAYKANPLFDRDESGKNKAQGGKPKGYITYGDMTNQTEINKKNPIYQQALADMRNSTGYAPGAKGPATMVAKKETSQNQPQGFMAVLENFLKQIAASEKQVYQKYLPANHMIIKIQAANVTDSVEFSRILCAALNEELQAESFTHTDGNSVEVECTINGPEQICFDSVKQLTAAVSDAFKHATTKIGGIEVKTQFVSNKKSSYQQISYKFASNQHRKFLLKFV
jgi:hypothetical protein